ERARLVGNDGHDVLAQFGQLQKRFQNGYKRRSSGSIAASRAVKRFSKRFKRRRLDFDFLGMARWHIATEFFAPCSQVLHLAAFGRKRDELNLLDYFRLQVQIEALRQILQFLFVQLLLLVRNVLAFAGLAKTVAFHSVGQDDARLIAVFDSALVGVKDLDGIVTAAS